MSNTPTTLPSDLAFTSFPFNSQLGEETEEPKENGGSGIRGLFNRFFSDGTQGTSSSVLQISSSTKNDTETEQAEMASDETPRGCLLFCLILKVI